MIRTVMLWLLLADIVFAALAVWMQGDWLINTQIAYLSSALVMGGSMLSYAQMIRRRLAAGVLPDGGDRDTIDRMEDPFDLYSEDPLPETNEPATAETIKTAIKEEKARMKEHRRSVRQTLNDSRAAMSLYRLGAYGMLLLGFFYLRGHHVLHPLPYLIGLAVPVVVIVSVLVFRKGSL